MSYPMLPPEVNSALMEAGAGSGPMLAAATAWTGLASELRSAASSFASVTSGLTGAAWQGPAAAAMAAAAAPYTAWLATAASHSEQAASQAAAVVGAFESAVAATVKAPLVAANRTVLSFLAHTNIFGQNVQALMAIESEYEQMWAQDVSAMGGYHAGASQAWSQLSPLHFLTQCLPGKPGAPTAPPGTGGAVTVPPPVTPPPVTPPPVTPPGGGTTTPTPPPRPTPPRPTPTPRPTPSPSPRPTPPRAGSSDSTVRPPFQPRTTTPERARITAE